MAVRNRCACPTAYPSGIPIRQAITVARAVYQRCSTMRASQPFGPVMLTGSASHCQAATM
jgi:hypothetical protein